MAERTVSVKLQAKVDQFTSGMKKAEAATKASKNAVEAHRKENVLMGKVAKVAGTIVAVQFAKKIINAASSLEETVNKSTVVFGKNAAAVQAWAKTSAKAFGMSENAALGAASTYGNLFVALGLTADESSKMSMSLVELAGDLASFNDASPEEALDALRSGLTGETEPLKRFGVNMNEATLKAQALKMGLISTTKEALDPAVKAQAAYSLILEQTTVAQGDFARTSDGLANQQRTLNGEWENAQAALGQTLLPAMTSAVSVLNNMLSAFNALPQPVKSAALGVAALSAALIVVLPHIVATKAAMADLGITAGAGAGKFKTAAKALGILAVAAAAGQAAFADADWKRASLGPEQAAAALEKLARGDNGNFGNMGADLRDMGEALDNLANPNLAERLQDGVFSVFTGSEGRAGRNQFLQDLRVLDQGLTKLVSEGKADEAKKALEQVRAQLDAEGKGDLFGELTKNLPGYTDAVAAAGRASGTAAGGVSDMGDAAGDAEKEVVDLETALKRLRGQAQSVAEANAGLEQAFDDATKAAKEMEGGLNKTRTALDLNTQAGRDGQDALFGIVDAAYDTAAALLEAGEGADTVKKRTMDARIEFIKAAEKMGLTTSAAKKLADKYGLIPSKIATTVTVNNAQALAAVDAVLARWQGILNMPMAVLNAHFGVTPPKKKAMGGYVTGPGTGTSDSIPARLSNGEYVVKAAAVKRYGLGMLNAINAGTAGSVAGTTGVAAAPAGGGGGGFSFHIENLVVKSSGEPVGESITRSVRGMAFQYGMGA